MYIHSHIQDEKKARRDVNVGLLALHLHIQKSQHNVA
jgi:hypothetical protein